MPYFDRIDISEANDANNIKSIKKVQYLSLLKTKIQIKTYRSYLPNSHFYKYKPYPCILHQHCVLRNHRKNKDIVITKLDKGSEVVILDQKLYNNAIQETISDTS